MRKRENEIVGDAKNVNKENTIIRNSSSILHPSDEKNANKQNS